MINVEPDFNYSDASSHFIGLVVNIVFFTVIIFPISSSITLLWCKIMSLKMTQQRNIVAKYGYWGFSVLSFWPETSYFRLAS